VTNVHYRTDTCAEHCASSRFVLKYVSHVVCTRVIIYSLLSRSRFEMSSRTCPSR
jgi:hypothetical protein